VGGAARRRRTLVGTARVALAGGNRRGQPVVTECPDERVELGDLLLALPPGDLNLVGQLFEFFERGALIELPDEWLGLNRVRHDD
jgi:hypothetical protein